MNEAQVAWVVARKEIMEHLRSKRVYIIGGLFFATFLAASILGIIFMDQLSGMMGMPPDEAGQSIRAILLFYFSIGGFTFVNVLALALSADRICGEWKNKSLFLLLSKPVSRSGMLAGKILGAYLSVAGIFVAVFLVCFLVLLAFLGIPDATSWGQILGGLGIVLLGLLPFVGLGILCSSLFRSPVASFIVALGLWFLVFPLIGVIGVLIDMFRGVGPEGQLAGFFTLLSPNSLIQAATGVWFGEQGMMGGGGGLATMGLPEQMALVVLAMLVHTTVYLGLSFAVVMRRDYD